MKITQKITPYLWFDDNAEDAMRFYTSIFESSKILEIVRYGDAGPGPKGSVMLGKFQLEGQEFLALNGGPMFQFTEAISLFVTCENQREVDELWGKLTAGGGAPSRCGWLKDKFGLSWQIVPADFLEMMRDPDPAKSKRVMQAMLQMSKLEVDVLRKAYEGS